MTRPLAVCALLLCAACVPVAPLDVDTARARLMRATEDAQAAATQQAADSARAAMDAQTRLQEAQAEQIEADNRRRWLQVTEQVGALTATPRAIATAEARAAELYAVDLDNRRNAGTAGWVAVIVVAVVGGLLMFRWGATLQDAAARQAEARAAVELRIADARAAEQEARAHIAQAEAIKAATVQIGGQPYTYDYRVGRMRSIAAPSPAIIQTMSRDQSWRAAILRVCRAADALGSFAAVDVLPYVTDPATGQPWERGLRDLYDAADRAGITTARRGKERTWAAGWSAARVERDYQTLTLPYLPDGDPPDVSLTVRSGEAGGSAELSEVSK